MAARIDILQPLFALALRLYVGQALLLSGLSKLRDSNVTLARFRDDYAVPLLPPSVAALLGTAAELTLPLLLVIAVYGPGALSLDHWLMRRAGDGRFVGR